MSGTTVALAVHTVVELAVIIRVMLRPHREPASRIAWVAVVTALPVIGILAYIFFGEVNIGRRRVARMRKVLERMPDVAGAAVGNDANIQAMVPKRYEHLFRLGHSISGFDPVGGNSARLLADSNATIDAMVADIDAAEQNSGLVFPKGSRKTAAFQTGFLWGGVIGGQIRVGGSSYRTGLQPGKIISPGVAEDPDLPKNRIYRVRRDVYPGGPTVNFASEIADEGGTADGIRAQYEKDWTEWPIGDGAPFLVQGAAGPVLTIADLTVIKFQPGDYLQIPVSNTGGLRAKGVVFTSSQDDTLAFRRSSPIFYAEGLEDPLLIANTRKLRGRLNAVLNRRVEVIDRLRDSQVIAVVLRAAAGLLLGLDQEPDALLEQPNVLDPPEVLDHGGGKPLAGLIPWTAQYNAGGGHH